MIRKDSGTMYRTIGVLRPGGGMLTTDVEHQELEQYGDLEAPVLHPGRRRGGPTGRPAEISCR